MILLSDYTPPGWLIDGLELNFRLSPSATQVTARMGVRPNPAAASASLLALV